MTRLQKKAFDTVNANFLETTYADRYHSPTANQIDGIQP